MVDKIRWGILSSANIGRRRVVPAIQESKNGVVAAVASRNLDKAQAFADELNIPTVYGSYEDLLADPNIDAIYNPLPNGLHAEWSIKCAEAGKASLCEKPLASDAAEAQSIVDAFASRDLLFAEAFMYRFHPQTQRVKAMIDDGAVGEVKMLQAAFSFLIQDEEDIRLSKPLAGGAVMDIGCYCINVIRLMSGQEPDQVRSIIRWGERSQVDETLSGILSFPSGAVGHFDCSFRTQFANSYEIRGPRGRIFVPTGFTMPANEESTIYYWPDYGSRQDITIPATNHYVLMAEDFADALLNSRPPRYPAQDAVQNMAVIDQLYAAAQ
jgi:xylose dehydrogenase (NAD/NADP)